ncbi:MAG TPA: hypothetical protein VNI77_08300 [Nitrososphaera sp.]|nr:hypothetical protein [Nitrososphaera sp.]
MSKTEVLTDGERLTYKSSFIALPIGQKIYFLSLLSHQVTVYARGAYPEQTQDEKVVGKLMTFNELQHNISGLLRDMLAKDEKRYPDDVFIDILFGKAQTGGCESDLAGAFDFAFKLLPPGE